MYFIAKNNKMLKSATAILILSFSSFFVNAQQTTEDKFKDQSLSVAINDKSCAKGVTITSPDNCKAEFGEGRGACGTKKDCVCSKKDKTITWTPDKNKKIEIKFTTAATPFKADCALKSGTSGKVSCKIKNKGTFDYDVYVEGCAGKPYDPRIVVQ
ncbi:hypothetical protein [Thalassomonas sp. M1454]|uniref:hypothetical protein n=1 Tax=Thalassomonas sp. M1454 TaxID=2594477 RepID=UPI00117C7897|nr:hypothetical protein [Thalassomonas sp. M1454]TRX55645.1 hypothetical protein FNN08_08400 [Thalassomonas sp. M1454]